jgi:GT2 family glycosyltransferase
MTAHVSVLLPYRQCSATIEEAARSILCQRGVDLELCAIDDGSTDDGPARVARLAAADRRVVPLSTGGVGIARALQAGLAAARGSIIARMDGDDVCAPERLARQLALLEGEPRLGAVGTRVEPFPAEAVGEGLRLYVAWQNELVTPADHARALFIEAPLCHPSVVLRRTALEQVGGWRDTGGPEDYDLWLRLDAAGWGLAKVPEVLFRWRHLPGRSTFADPRYDKARFLAIKAPHLARRVRAWGRPLSIWGAGRTGKRLARALEPCGLRPRRFIDIAPRKLGGFARGVTVEPATVLDPAADAVVVAVSARGARALIRAHLDAAGFVEGESYLCAA